MTTIDYPQLYIGGTWTAPAGHDTIGVHSPATEERIGSVPRGTESDIDSAVAAARTAFDAPDGWSTLGSEGTRRRPRTIRGGTGSPRS